MISPLPGRLALAAFKDPAKILRRTIPMLAAFLAWTGALAEGASTDPRGVYTVKVAGRPPGALSARTYLGLQLLPGISYVGPVAQVSGNTLSLASLVGNAHTTLEVPGMKSYVHVLNGSGRWFITDIGQFRQNDMVCATDLTTWITPGTLVMIRPHPNIAGVFGAENRFGLGAGPNAGSADNVVIWDSAAQEEKVFYFHSSRNRWEEKDIEADAGLTPLRFPYGLYIVRRSAGSLRIVLSGDLAFQSVLLPVRKGANVFSLPVNLSASLENLIHSDGDFPVLKGRNVLQADSLTFEEPSTATRKGPFYFRSKPSDSGWREVGVNDSDEPVQALDMLSTLILRRNGTAGHLLVEGSLNPGPGTPLPPDPEPGEVPLTAEFPLPPSFPAEVLVVLETSTDLQTWTSIGEFTRLPDRAIFQVPPGQSRAFYRATLSLAP